MKPNRKKNGKFGARWGARGSAAATIAARLTFEHITHGFDGTGVLSDVSLDIDPGEIICLLGPSGCGKTTLLRLAAGIEPLDYGRILIENEVVSGPNIFVPPERRGIGLVFQDFALFPHLTILQNVTFGLKGLDRAEKTQAAMATLERVGLASMSSEYPHILSGGEQQRVALARAIVPRPNVLLLDEPFSGLDKQLRETMREETLSILQETRTTCLMVTHHSEEAMRMGDRIAVMRRGRLVQLDTAEVLYENPANLIVARMFSEINEITCAVSGGRLCTPLGDFFGDLSAHTFPKSGHVTLSIRQQDIQINPPNQGQSARILAVKFLGDFALLEIGVEGLDLPLLARLNQAETASVGTEVSVQVKPEDVRVFTETQESDFKN